MLDIIYILGYLILVNIVGFIIMGIDKWKAVGGRYRISEKNLLIPGILGGIIGLILGMILFHHKTRKPGFKLLVFLVLLLNGIYWYLIHIWLS